MGKRLKKTFAVFMAICITISGMSPILMHPTYATGDDPVNHAVDISFSPQNLVGGGVLMKIKLILKQDEVVLLY